MVKKKVLDFMVLIEQLPDGWFIAKVPDIQGCYSQGKTIPQALERVKEAIQVCLESDQTDFPAMKFIGLQKVEIEA